MLVSQRSHPNSRLAAVPSALLSFFQVRINRSPNHRAHNAPVWVLVGVTSMRNGVRHKAHRYEG